MLTLAAFVAAISLLVAVHELGHFSVARACGVKVLRFSIGFGPRVVGWTSKRSGTEYVVGVLPLGGYVKMLDEREAPVDSAQRHLAFNTQALYKRVAIVAAGPLANLLLAVLLYAGVHWNGLQQTRAVLASPVAGSIAAISGLRGGELVTGAAFEGDEPASVQSFEDIRWWLTRAVLQGRDLRLEYTTEAGHVGHSVLLPLSALPSRQADPTVFREIGLVAPFARAVLGELSPDGAARMAGLKPSDQVISLDGAAISDAAQLRDLIRQSGHSGSAQPQNWLINRDGRAMTIVVQPKVVASEGGTVGRVGAVIGAPPEMLTVRYGPWDGLMMGVDRTWQVSTLSLTMLGRMLTGEASVKNLSGPITIADYAGQSAALGVTPFLVFLALISVSLGVLNLLPLPVLDGGHLVYYLWEWITGRPVSEFWMENLQRAGLAVLLMMMSIAIYNDLARLTS